MTFVPESLFDCQAAILKWLQSLGHKIDDDCLKMATFPKRRTRYPGYIRLERYGKPNQHTFFPSGAGAGDYICADCGVRKSKADMKRCQRVGVHGRGHVVRRITLDKLYVEYLLSTSVRMPPSSDDDS